MADIEIGEINTQVEIAAPSGTAAGDLRAVVEAVLQRLRDKQAEDQMRGHDDRMRDRSWKSDVKPD